MSTWRCRLNRRQNGNLRSSLSDTSRVASLRASEKPGATVVFLSSLGGPDGERAAEQQGFSKSTSITSLRIEGRDRSGLSAQIARAVGNAGVNMRGVSAARMSGQAMIHIALDSVADADKARLALKKALNG